MKKGKSKRATIEELAAHCGVSKMTVARAFRPDQPVSAATRRKVLEKAEAVGFQPRARMGRPRHAKSQERICVEVIVGMTVHSMFYSELLMGVVRELASKGHDCIVRSADGGFEEFVALCEVLRATPPAETLVVGYLPSAQLRALLEVRPEAVLVDHTGDPALELPCSSIAFDNAEAARIAVRHLIAGGRKRILLVNGFAGHYFSRDVEFGYREALAYAGLSVDPDLIMETDFTAELAVSKVDQALNDGLRFDAIFTGDEMAAGLLYLLHQRGIRVPADVAVVGCDGLPFGRYTVPPLTTVLLDQGRLGRTAVKHVLDTERSEGERCNIRLLPCLEQRESTEVTKQKSEGSI